MVSLCNLSLVPAGIRKEEVRGDVGGGKTCVFIDEPPLCWSEWRQVERRQVCPVSFVFQNTICSYFIFFVSNRKWSTCFVLLTCLWVAVLPEKRIFSMKLSVGSKRKLCVNEGGCILKYLCGNLDNVLISISRQIRHFFLFKNSRTVFGLWMFLLLMFIFLHFVQKHTEQSETKRKQSWNLPFFSQPQRDNLISTPVTTDSTSCLFHL